jgi:hypothetical protein
MSSLPCFLCGRKLNTRFSKHKKPYFVCDSCGIQLFIRRQQGIKRLQALFKNTEHAELAFKQHAHNFYEIQAILKEIDDVSTEMGKYPFYFFSSEQTRVHNLLKTRIDTLFAQLEELATKKTLIL